MRYYFIACLFVFTALTLSARDKVIREGMIITTSQDTIEGLVDISTDFNFQVYYKNDSAQRRFRKIKSKHVQQVIYDDKVFERIPYKSKQIIALNLVSGSISLYADFLPAIAPGNNSSMLSSVQTSKTRKVYYLVSNNQTIPINSRNYVEVLQNAFADKSEIHSQINELNYVQMLDVLPYLVLKYNQL